MTERYIMDVCGEQTIRRSLDAAITMKPCGTHFPDGCPVSDWLFPGQKPPGGLADFPDIAAGLLPEPRFRLPESCFHLASRVPSDLFPPCVPTAAPLGCISLASLALFPYLLAGPKK